MSFALAPGNTNPQGIADPPAGGRLELGAARESRWSLAGAAGHATAASFTRPLRARESHGVARLAREQAFTSLGQRPWFAPTGRAPYHAAGDGENPFLIRKRVTEEDCDVRDLALETALGADDSLSKAEF